MMNYREIQHCRVCGNKDLEHVLDLGSQSLTGVFLNSKLEVEEIGPLQLVKCINFESSCGLVQLKHSFEPTKMYGDNYGYRSGLNQSMVQHLGEKVHRISQKITLVSSDLVLDIGSNDGTTLSFYDHGLIRVGIDPTANKFREYYNDNVIVLSDFFSAKLFKQKFKSKKAKVVTSFSMFYDLEDPVSFAQDVYEILSDDGIWIFEQSYLPTMIEKNSFDTICHEHIEYYALKQIKWIVEKSHMKIIDVEFNDINGGSFSITAAKIDANYSEYEDLGKLLNDEEEAGFNDITRYKEFELEVKKTAKQLKSFVQDQINNKKSVAFLGASTKGNVILQYCGFDANDVVGVADVNKEKFGKYTPGTKIPIISEYELLENEPDYIIVLIWHFRDFLLQNLRLKHAKLVFPLPTLQIMD